MQRVRMSLPYFKSFGWDAEVVAVDPSYVDMAKDTLLTESVPGDVKIHWVKALSKKLTSKIGFGGIAYRAYPFIKKEVNRVLRTQKFDLVYFSTTQFQVCNLGPYWRKKFGIPYIIDMQDPWHSEYYQDKPKNQRPPKYWLSYRMNKYLEPLSMSYCSGLISVSSDYIDTLKLRYPLLANVPSATITFGSFEPDMQIAVDHAQEFTDLLNSHTKNVVYVGRGGKDMYNAIRPVFAALQKGLSDDAASFESLHFYFIGTSYAPAGKGEPSILPLAGEFAVENNVTELTDRIGYYHTLNTLQKADALFIPGSDDPAYTASKIYPYLLAGKPLFSIFNSRSPANRVLQEFGSANTFRYDETPGLNSLLYKLLQNIAAGRLPAQSYNEAAMSKYSAKSVAKRQCELFDLVV
jgi:hypothetical protein